jgi:hypothetical protein
VALISHAAGRPDDAVMQRCMAAADSQSQAMSGLI